MRAVHPLRATCHAREEVSSGERAGEGSNKVYPFYLNEGTDTGCVINGLVGTYSRIAGSSNSGGTAPGGGGGEDDRPVIE